MWRSLETVGRATLLLASFAVLANSSAASAADYSLGNSALRGSYAPALAPSSRALWDGIYFGGQFGRSFTNADFQNASSSQLSYILANTELQGLISDWATLPHGSTGTNSYGGFAGFSTHWDDIVGSLELNYSRVKASIGESGSVGPIILNGATLPSGNTVQYTVTVASSASIALNDVFQARARLGWSYDCFLPYGFFGLAVGRADVIRTTSVSGTKTVTDTTGTVVSNGALILPRNPQSDTRSTLGYGFSTGIGLDIAVLQNVFVRGEWEFIQFPNIQDVRVSMNSARVGVGVKF